MNRERIGVLVRSESLYIRRLWIPLVLYLLLPVVLAAFMQNAMHRYLNLIGYPNANGAEFVIPAQLVLFCYLLTEHVGLWVFAEHTWGTWDRVRASPATTVDVMTAKGVLWTSYLLAQSVALLVIGRVAFGLHIAGSALAFGVLIVMTVMTAMAFGFCGLAVCGSQAAFDVWTYGGTLVMGAVGGAITHFDLLPSWAKVVAPASPIYWSMLGSRDVVLSPGGFAEIAMPCGVLCAFAVGFGLIGWWRFDPAVTKIGRTK